MREKIYYAEHSKMWEPWNLKVKIKRFQVIWNHPKNMIVSEGYIRNLIDGTYHYWIEFE